MNHLKKHLKSLSCLVALCAVISGCATKAKEDKSLSNILRPEMQFLGARNWIVIAEAAFPIQTRSGIKVMSVNEDIPIILESVEAIMEETYHVTPRIYLTAEMEDLAYDYAPGIKHYSKQLQQALDGRPVLRLDHEMLLQMLKSSSKDYQVLVIKSRTALPYSSVFMELGSGYWGTEAESVLRDAMEKKLTPVDSPITETSETILVSPEVPKPQVAPIQENP